MKNYLTLGLNSVFDIVAPRTCVVCGRQLLLHERFLCIQCLADLPRTYYSTLSRNPLSERFNALVQRDMDKLLDSPPECSYGAGKCEYVYATSLFFYRHDTGYRQITQRLKYHADFEEGKFFSKMLASQLATSPYLKGIDAVVPVPLHWTRMWSRGYNQSEVIARVLAQTLGAELRTDILERKHRTKTQTKLSITEKAHNVEGAFGIVKGVKIPEYSHLLLVDDVFTTGATLHSCYLALRQNKNISARISLATLACI